MATPTRRIRQGPGRRRIYLSVTADERGRLAAAAEAAGVTVAAYCTQAALATVDERTAAPMGLERELLAELTQARTQTVKVGTNLNQAVRKVNETGRVPTELAFAAAAAADATEEMLLIAAAAAKRFGVRR